MPSSVVDCGVCEQPCNFRLLVKSCRILDTKIIQSVFDVVTSFIDTHKLFTTEPVAAKSKIQPLKKIKFKFRPSLNNQEIEFLFHASSAC